MSTPFTSSIMHEISTGIALSEWHIIKKVHLFPFNLSHPPISHHMLDAGPWKFIICFLYPRRRSGTKRNLEIINESIWFAHCMLWDNHVFPEAVPNAWLACGESKIYFLPPLVCCVLLKRYINDHHDQKPCLRSDLFSTICPWVFH